MGDTPAVGPRRTNLVIGLIVVVLAVATLVGTFVIVFSTQQLGEKPKWALVRYPVGRLDTSEVSGRAAPGAHALPGYRETYVTDFPGTALPSGWFTFAGVPGGDPGAQFGPAHVVVDNGRLLLKTYRDPAYHNEWVTGGLCQCGHPQTYGAFFVRSRIDAPGPNEVALLWPSSNKWPPEIDFNESAGAYRSTSATIHFTIANHIEQAHVGVAMSHWHTWGVIWTPTAITMTVDGHPWARFLHKKGWPAVPMDLNLEQRTSCSVGADCPSRPVTMQVNWVAEYQATTKAG